MLEYCEKLLMCDIVWLSLVADTLDYEVDREGLPPGTPAAFLWFENGLYRYIYSCGLSFGDVRTPPCIPL